MLYNRAVAFCFCWALRCWIAQRTIHPVPLIGGSRVTRSPQGDGFQRNRPPLMP